MPSPEGIKIIELLENQEYTLPGKEGILASIATDCGGLLAIRKRDELIRMASEPSAEDTQTFCSGTSAPFQPDLSPVGLIGHVIEHLTVTLAAKEAVDKGHRAIRVEGETISYPRGAGIKIEMSSDKGRGFNLKVNLTKAMGEVEDLLRR